MSLTIPVLVVADLEPASPVVGCDEAVELNGVRVPDVSLPTALTKKGLRVGIEIDGPSNSDRGLLGIALTLERILGRLPAPPGF